MGVQVTGPRPGARRRVGLVAYHFPPVQGSSGVQRTLKATRYLPEFGWTPRVLTVWPSAYPATHPGQLGEIPDVVEVARLPALDSARHLSIAGRYPSWLASPDRYISWAWLGFPAACRFLAQHPVDVLVSTYPIASAHVLGGRLARVFRLPWVADFRDLMLDESYPREPRARRAAERIEASTLRRADRVLVTTPGARRILIDRYPQVAPERIVVIENGFDEENFVMAAEKPPPAAHSLPFLLHSGVVYPAERNPEALFTALAMLRDAGFLAKWPFEIVLRASGHEGWLEAQLRKFDIEAWVRLAPPLGYIDALAEMLGADGLLVLQGPDCNHQIPAKLYEYLRAGRPILALTDAAGDTAGLLRAHGVTAIADMMSAQEIAAKLAAFIPELTAGKLRGPDPQRVASASRHARCAQLASVLDAVLAEHR